MHLPNEKKKETDMGNLPHPHASLWLEGKKKLSKKSKKRKRLSQNLPLIQFLFKWKVAAFSLGKIHYTFDKLQEKAFHAEPLKKKITQHPSRV